MKKRTLLYCAAFLACSAFVAADGRGDERPQVGRTETRREAVPARAAERPRENRPQTAPEVYREAARAEQPRAAREVSPGAAIRIIRQYAPPAGTRPAPAAGTRIIRETPQPGTPAGRNNSQPRQVVVPEPRRFERPDAVVSDQRRAVEPKTLDSGEPVRQEREKKPPQEHRSVMRHPELLRAIQGEQRAEVIRNHYYWHNNGGVKYAHYYDEHGTHWYGFYHGPKFYWCRYYAANWWWHDGMFDRWVFWWDGYWWWWGPGGIAYVYVADNYYPYDMGFGQTVVEAPETENPPAPPPSPTDGELWLTPDETRMVQVYGDEAGAFLYDNTGDEPVYRTYLGRDVSGVRFDEGPPVRIILDFKDRSFALYDLDGSPKEPPASDPPQAEQPPAPEAVPPVPDSAPGQ